MRFSQFYDKDSKITKGYLEVTPIQAKRLIQFLEEQLYNYPPDLGKESLTNKCLLRHLERQNVHEARGIDRKSVV